jgi:hypothetical protein
MIKISEKRILVLAVLLSVLLVYNACASSLPTAHAQVITETTNTQWAMDLLSNVVGINTNAYAVNLTSHTTTATAVSSLAQDNVIFNLTANNNSMQARFTFINGNLNLLYLSNGVGSSSINQPTANALVSAQGFLQRYQSYTDNQLFGSLSSMLNNVAPNTNKTETVGNVKLQASVLANQAEQDLIWTYVDNNGVPALMKDVVLSYHDGQLESFLDNWQLYTIEGVPSVTSQDAVATALQAAKNYSYMAEDAEGNNVTVSGFKIASVFNVSLSYVNYYEPNSEQSIRGGDPYVLYPSWYVGVGFNQVYPGGVTGLNIRVWADSGNVSSVEPIIWNLAKNASSTSTNSESHSVSATMSQLTMMPILLPIVALTAGSTIAAYVCISGDSLQGFKHTWKKCLNNRKVIPLGLILPLILLIVFIPSARCTTIGKSDTFATEAGYPNYPDPFDNAEIAASTNMVYNIYGNYSHAGVTPYYAIYPHDDQQAGSDILGEIQSDESNYNNLVVFAYGNGPMPYWDYSDSPSMHITTTQIASCTTDQKIIFVWQFTCQSAGYSCNPYSPDNGAQVNMSAGSFANAWMPNSGITSVFGFDIPDSSGHCFIGFAGEAPMLSQDSFQGYTQLAYIFVEDFYEAATSGYTVHNSLNLASEEVFGVPYDFTPLNAGYMAWWPGGVMPGMGNIPQGWDYAGFMMVYGDSNINICPAVTAETVSTPSISNPNNSNGDGNPNTPYYLDVSSTDSNGYPVSYLINWGDGSNWVMAGPYSSGAQAQVQHTYSSDGVMTVTVYAVSQDGVWSSCNTYTATIGGNFFGTWFAADFTPTSVTINPSQSVSYTVNIYPQTQYAPYISDISGTFTWYVNNAQVSQTTNSQSSSLTYTFNSAGTYTVECKIAISFLYYINAGGYGHWYEPESDSITCTGSVTVT